MVLFIFFFRCVLRLHETYSIRVGLLVCMWLEKYRPFYVALALCLSFSLVGGLLNESLGHRVMSQSGGGEMRKRRENLYLRLLKAYCSFGL